jgi:hypothetical protein
LKFFSVPKVFQWCQRNATNWEKIYAGPLFK